MGSIGKARGSCCFSVLHTAALAFCLFDGPAFGDEASSAGSANVIPNPFAVGLPATGEPAKPRATTPSIEPSPDPFGTANPFVPAQAGRPSTLSNESDRPRVTVTPLVPNGPKGQGSAGKSGDQKSASAVTPTAAAAHGHADGKTRPSRPEGTEHVAMVEPPGVVALNPAPEGRGKHIEVKRPDGSQLIVDHTVYSGRRVEATLPGDVRIVAMGRTGYVERPLARGYVSRTYVTGNQAYARVYQTFAYQGVTLYHYVPPVSYSPAFYAWVVEPWAGPVPYNWQPEPWAGLWNGYFAPERAYPDATLWVTDFVLRENLKEAYEDQPAPSGPAPAQEDGTTLSPEIKYLIAAQIRQQVETARSATAPTPAAGPGTAAGPGHALDQKIRVFVVSTPLDIKDPANAQSCTLTPGEIIERTLSNAVDGRFAVVVVSGKPGGCPVEFATTLDIATLADMHDQFRAKLTEPGDVNGLTPAALEPRNRVFVVATRMTVTTMQGGRNCRLTPGDVIERTSTTVSEGALPVAVLSSKPGDCSLDIPLAVDLADLQEMHNRFREMIADGLAVLAAGPGRGGLPGRVTPGGQPVPAGQAVPDAGARSLLVQQLQDADKADEDIRKTSGG